MQRVNAPPRRYEEHAFVLDVNPHGRSSTVRGREGIIVTAVGEGRLTLLEMLGVANSSFGVGERVYIGRQGRTKILSVLGKIGYDRITGAARGELPAVVEAIVAGNEEKFVGQLNSAGPLTPRIHMLELIPGIGKTYLKTMLDERGRRRFEGYDDLEERVGFKDPVKQISKRIMEEITGEARMNIFVKR